MAVVVFNYLGWAARYPELAATANQDLAELYFLEAELFVNNSPWSVVCDVARRTLFLNMVTAHIAWLSAPDRQGVVGRLSQASEGSVSASFDYGTQAASAAFWLQSPYGASFWQATAGYRTMHYLPGPPSSAQLPAGFYFSGARQPGQW